MPTPALGLALAAAALVVVADGLAASPSGVPDAAGLDDAADRRVDAAAQGELWAWGYSSIPVTTALSAPLSRAEVRFAAPLPAAAMLGAAGAAGPGPAAAAVRPGGPTMSDEWYRRARLAQLTERMKRRAGL